jgi:hypothetical protein
MRWPFRRRTAESVPSDAPVERDSPQGSVATPSDPASVERAPARQWATLPVISTTVPLAAPLVVGPAPVVPLLRLDDRRGAATVEPPTGTVTGLARAVPRAVEPATPAAQAEVVAAPLVRRAVRSTPAEVTPLVDAVDEYVGEPREPAEPHRAPGWLRFMPDWAKQGQPSIPGLPTLPDLPVTPAPPAPPEPSGAPEMIIAEPPSFLPAELRNPPKAELPPRVAEAVAPEAEIVAPPVRKRRPSLGQTRRLGLGAPIAKPDLLHPEPPPIVEGTVETPQEPPPPPAAPARVVTEPEPEPSSQEPEPPVQRPETARETPTPATEPTPPRTEPSPPKAIPTGVEPAPPVKPVPATYRATPELRPAPRRERPRATVVDRVPAALANEVRTRQRADVTDVPVYRGPQVDEAAKTRGARAFAAGGAVFLPDEAGPTDSPKARGLLAHELVHAVQQRTLGPRLPAPDSPLGQHLEAEAQAAERFYGGEAGAAEPPPLIHAPMPAQAPAPEPDLSMAAQLATELAAAAPAPTPAQQALASPFDSVTTEEVGKIATESARHVVAEWTNPMLYPQNTQQQGQSSAAHSDTGSHGSSSQRTAFNASARREQLMAAALATHNRNLAPGESPVTSLSHDELAAIDRQITTEVQHHDTHGTSPHGAHGSHGSHGAHSRPSARTTQQHQPAEQRHVAGSGAAWMHAITGMNMSSGFGARGLTAPAGSADSWFDAPSDDPAVARERNRPFGERLADQMGLISPETTSMFDTDSWWQPADENEDDSTAQGRGGSRGGGGSIAEMDGTELDELAARLYDRLRTKLRTELLVDRERAGMLTDFR